MARQFDEGNKFRRIATKLHAPTKALEQIGAIVVSQTERRFKAQAFDGKPWAERSNPNVYGILSDLSLGKNPPRRRFQGRPALRDTGALARSFDWRIVARDRVAVGTDLKYAKVHQEGGEIESAKITGQVRSRLYRFLKGKPKKVRQALGFLFNKKFKGKTLKGKAEQRQMLGITESDQEEVLAVVPYAIFEAKK